MKRRFIAFYDILIFSITAGIMWTVALIILITGQFGNFDWCVENLKLVLAFAICISIPVTMVISLQKITIDLLCDKVELFYLVNYSKNDKDLHSNWIFYPSEIENVEVVKLSKEEKRKYTSAKFLFSKYLKIEMKYGHTKYVYVSHYSNGQIQNIVKILNSNKKV